LKGDYPHALLDQIRNEKLIELAKARFDPS